MQLSPEVVGYINEMKAQIADLSERAGNYAAEINKLRIELATAQAQRDALAEELGTTEQPG